MIELQKFLDNAIEILKQDDRILAVCAAGSWITKEVDEFSDLDLILITSNPISKSKDEMRRIAINLGNLIVCFTGEHVGESRLLICLYENPLIHVDLKFLLPDELYVRVENPTIIWEREQSIRKIYESSVSKWPYPEFQWIEDRFWVWIHYVATKLGRGEYFESIDFLSFLRNTVIGPLFHIKYGSLPRGVRKIEFILNDSDLIELRKTIPEYSFHSIRFAVLQMIELYKKLREDLFDSEITKRTHAENVSLKYIHAITEK